MVRLECGDCLDRVVAFNFCMAVLAVKHEQEIIAAFELEGARIEAENEIYGEEN